MTDKAELKRLAAKIESDERIGYVDQDAWHEFQMAATPLFVSELIGELEAKEAEIADCKAGHAQAWRICDEVAEALGDDLDKEIGSAASIHALRASREADVERAAGMAIDFARWSNQTPEMIIAAVKEQMKGTT